MYDLHTLMLHLMGPRYEFLLPLYCLRLLPHKCARLCHYRPSGLTAIAETELLGQSRAVYGGDAIRGLLS